MERQWQGSVFVAILLVGLAGCGVTQPSVPARFLTETKAFRGVVATDEPRATQIGETILNGGGTAGDAAAAVALALAVTYPAAAGIGGGGACIAYEPATGEAQAVDFLPKRPPGGGEIAMPGFARGIGAVHGRYGRMPIGQVIAPAENLARFGNQASRAFMQRLEAARDPELAGHWQTVHLAPVVLGRTYVQPDLANTLAMLRVRGFGSLNIGPGARALAETLGAAGGKITPEDLRDLGAEWKKAQGLVTGDVTIHVAGGTLLGGPDVLANWRNLIANDAYDKASAANKQATLQRGAVAGAGGERGGSTSFIVADRFGLMIGCVLTMGQEFGTRRMLHQHGFLAATPADDGGMAAFVLVAHVLKRAFAVGAASGPGSAAGLMTTFAPMWVDARHVDWAIANRPVAGDARVNIVFCPNSIPSSAEICYPATDPRGHGFAVGGVK